MAQNLIIANVQYSNVPAIDITKVGGGMARFVDPTGNKEIESSGTHDVATFATASVLPAEVAVGGDYDEDEILSLDFNQQLNVTAKSSTASGITYTKNSDGSWTITGTTTTNNHFYNLNYVNGNTNANHMVAGHKYFIGGKSSDNRVYLSARNDGGNPNSMIAVNGIGEIVALATSTWSRIQIQTSTPIGTAINATIYPQIIDLTQMYGAGNEPSTVEEFKAMFPLDYYPYNPGETVSIRKISFTSSASATQNGFASGQYNGSPKIKYVSGGGKPEQAKTATANGTIYPDTGYVLSSVTVAIPIYDGSVS